MRWPSGENATDKTEDLWIANGPATFSPTVAFHTRILPSPEPETMCWLSGENATDLTRPPGPENGPATISPAVAFHTRILLSCESETMRWSSGENVTRIRPSSDGQESSKLESESLADGPASISPVMAFHTRIVLSSEPETMRWPSGENATDETQPLCPVNSPASGSPVMTFHT